MKYIVLVLTMVAACFVGALFVTTAQSAITNKTVVSNVVERQLPVFRLASYQVNYSGRIYKTSTDTLLRVPTGSYSVRIDYDAVVLIGTRVHPMIELKDNTIILDFTEVELEVLAATPTSIELVNAATTGLRWFIGGGIPIQEGLFTPFMDAIEVLPSLLTADEELQERALESLILQFRSFYSMLNYTIEVRR